MKASRTYKLRLSEAGIDLFLAGHCRLAHLVRDFIPYGTTLSVALTILEMQDACEVAAELEAARCKHVLGNNIRFVGTSAGLVDATRRISDKLLKSDELFSAPKNVELYAAALGCLSSAEDELIFKAFQAIDRETR